jgi:peptidoglycan/xylan/chitin deacetylase (PgdA/CDA1 family)
LCSVRKAPITFENVDYFPHPVHGIYINAHGKRLSHELKKKDINEINSFIGELQHSLDRPIPQLLVDTYRTMGSAEILELSLNPLFTIGSHSNKHIPLSGKNEADQYVQLKISKEILEKITGNTIPDLAFPDGSYDETTIKLAIDLGYTNLYGVIRNETLPLIKSRKGLYTDEPWYHQLAI